MGVDSMKTPEDEAFDELAKKQGMWGGGFQAKRQMAADKINADFDDEYIKYRDAFPKEYTTPPKRPWVGLTNDEVAKFVEDVDWYNFPMDLVRASEAKLKEKNT
jgi:pyruvate/2-oxoglutarate dehydrogenase complex dihydrolipoamide dehydrogenase (E3) component